MKELVIKKIGYGTLSYIYAVAFGTVGFGTSLIFAFANSIGVGDQTNSLLAGLAFGLTAGFVTVIIVTAVYALIGALVGVINAVILNYLLVMTNGLTITVEDK